MRHGGAWREPRRGAARAPAAVLVAAILASGCAPGPDGSAGRPGQGAAERFEGAWFTIEVPAGFSVRPSLPSETAEGYDSAFFVSPDERATFYVCSPQWGRQATDVAPDPASEEVISDRAVEIGELSVERLEIAAVDGSYRRLVEVFFSPAAGAQWVFGFRWADERAYEEHRQRYEEFKASLEQYAD